MKTNEQFEAAVVDMKRVAASARKILASHLGYKDLPTTYFAVSRYFDDPAEAIAALGEWATVAVKHQISVSLITFEREAHGSSLYMQVERVATPVEIEIGRPETVADEEGAGK